MSTMLCPNCRAEIKKPGNLWSIVVGLLAVFLFSGFMLIIVCLVAITAIGASVNEEMDRAGGAILAEQSDDFGLNNTSGASAARSGTFIDD